MSEFIDSIWLFLDGDTLQLDIIGVLFTFLIGSLVLAVVAITLLKALHKHAWRVGMCYRGEGGHLHGEYISWDDTMPKGHFRRFERRCRECDAVEYFDHIEKRWKAVPR